MHTTYFAYCYFADIGASWTKFHILRLFETNWPQSVRQNLHFYLRSWT